MRSALALALTIVVLLGTHTAWTSDAAGISCAIESYAPQDVSSTKPANLTFLCPPKETYATLRVRITAGVLPTSPNLQAGVNDLAALLTPNTPLLMSREAGSDIKTPVRIRLNGKQQLQLDVDVAKVTFIQEKK